jgi:hypothetical protein
MPLYIPYLILVALFGVISIQENKSIIQEGLLDDSDHPNQGLPFAQGNSWKLFLFAFIVIATFTCFRHISSPAIDEYAYRNRWSRFSNLSLFEVFESHHEYIFESIYWLSTRIFNTDQGGIFLTSFITFLGLLWSLKRDSLDFSYGIVLLLATGLVYNTLNGIQHYFTTAIYFMFYPCLLQQRWKQYIILIIACMLMHQSAIFLTLFYFTPQFKLNNNRNIIIATLGVAILLGLLYNYVSFFAMYFKTFETYADINSTSRHGVKWITILISAAASFLVIKFKDRIPLQDKVTTNAAKMVLIHAGIMLASSIDTYIARFGIFTEPFIMLFLARISPYFQDKRKYMVFKIATIILYSMVTILRMRFDKYYWNSNLW